MTRITNKQLDNLVNRINKATGSPSTYITVKDGQRIININHYHLDSAYGGVKIVRTCNDGGGIQDISRNGYGTKRQAYDFMEAFLIGLEANK